MERIIAASPLKGNIRYHYRNADGGVTYGEEPVSNYFLIGDDAYQTLSIDGIKITRLAGDNYFQFRVDCDNQRILESVLKALNEEINKKYNTSDEIYNNRFIFFISDKVQRTILDIGKTFFQGINSLDELTILVIDIEVFNSRGVGHFPDPNLQADEIILIGLRNNRSEQWIIDRRNYTSDEEVILALITLINQIDPDIIVGHNVHNFDLSYIATRAKHYGIVFTIGREWRRAYCNNRKFTFDKVARNFQRWFIPGRSIIDTMHLAMHHDTVTRKFESYGLKDIVAVLGMEAPDRVHIPGDQISAVWQTDPERLARYLMNDLEDTLNLFHFFAPTFFELAKILPFQFDALPYTGAGTLIDRLLIKEYIGRDHSIPRPQRRRQYQGGYTRLIRSGRFENVTKADFTSMYPNIVITYDIKPASDQLNIFTTFQKSLLERRLQLKKAMKAAEDKQERQRLDAQQGALKILINSFYGLLGHGYGHFNYYGAAEEVTGIGRKLVQQVQAEVGKRGGTVIETDTDGVYFQLPPGIDSGLESERKFISEINTTLPGGMTIEHDGRWQAMLSIKSKTYALLGYDGKLTIKGGLRSRSIPKIFREYLRELILLSLQGADGSQLHDCYERYRDHINNRNFPPEEICKRVSLKNSAQTYLEKIKRGQARRAEYELLLKYGKSHNIRQGDQIQYYVKQIEGEKGPKYKRVELLQNYNNDADTEELLRQLAQISKRLEPLFDPDEFKAIFSPDGSDTNLDNIKPRETVYDNNEEKKLWIELGYGFREPGPKGRKIFVPSGDEEATDKFRAEHKNTNIHRSLFAILSDTRPTDLDQWKTRPKAADFVIEVEQDLPTGDARVETLSNTLDVATYVVGIFVKDCNVPPGGITVTYNGNKSFYINVPQAALDVPNCIELPEKYRRFAEHIRNLLPENIRRFVDMNLYQSKHMIRLEGSIHHKTGLKGVTFTAQELSALTIEEIIDLAASGVDDE